jgi:hypothetical protein
MGRVRELTLSTMLRRTLEFTPRTLRGGSGVTLTETSAMQMQHTLVRYRHTLAAAALKCPKGAVLREWTASQRLRR